MKCCVSTDVGTWTNWLTFEPDPDHSPDAGTGLLSPISYRLRNFAALRRLPASCAATLLRRENPTYTYWLRAAIERAVVLKWFYSLSRHKTFVGGKCALPSALLVLNNNIATAVRSWPTSCSILATTDRRTDGRTDRQTDGPMYYIINRIFVGVWRWTTLKRSWTCWSRCTKLTDNQGRRLVTTLCRQPWLRRRRPSCYTVRRCRYDGTNPMISLINIVTWWSLRRCSRARQSQSDAPDRRDRWFATCRTSDRASLVGRRRSGRPCRSCWRRPSVRPKSAPSTVRRPRRRDVTRRLSASRTTKSTIITFHNHTTTMTTTLTSSDYFRFP